MLPARCLRLCFSLPLASCLSCLVPGMAVQKECSPLHWAPPLQVFSSGPGPLSLAEPEPVRDPDGVPPVDGGSFLGPLQSGHSAVDAAVGTLSFLAWRIETVCKKVRQARLRATRRSAPALAE